MEWNGIELHNVRGLEKTPRGGYAISRLPLSLEPHVKANARVASGVELRLVPIDDEVRIKLRTTDIRFANGIVFYGDVLSGWRELYKPVCTDEECEIVVRKSRNAAKMTHLAKVTGASFSPEVVRVVLQSGCYELLSVSGKCRPPRPDELPRKTYLAYGSSITHGSLALHPCEGYPFRTAAALGVDHFNLGFAGRALLEKEMADFIADECHFDFATLEMGINMLADYDVEEFARRVRYFVKRIATAHPRAKIYCIDIFYQESDLLAPDDEDRKANLFRRAVKNILEELALPNVVHLPGLTLLDGAEYLTEDLTHPNIFGVERLAQNLSAALQKSNL